MKTLFKAERSRWLISIDFEPQDIWIGLHWKKHLGPRIDLWLILIPTLAIHIELVYRDVFKRHNNTNEFRKAIDSLNEKG